MDSQVHDSSHVDQTNKSVPLGSVMHDTGKITGGLVTGFSPAPITFQFYSNGTCTGEGTPVANTGADEGDASRDRSASSASLGGGSYSYKAFVAGNANYIGSDSGCEPFTVSKGTPSAATTLHNASGGGVIANGTALSNGSGVFDTAQVTTTDSFALTGTVTFQFFTNGSCSGTPASTQAGVAITNGSATSSSHLSLGTGSYSFNAQYVAGTDANHLSSAISSCEPFSVNTPPSSPPTPHPAISIMKNPKSQTILPAQTATFTIAVTNTGDDTLTNVHGDGSAVARLQQDERADRWPRLDGAGWRA